MNSLNQWILCMDIGGTNIRTGMVNKEYRVENFVITDSQSILDGISSTENLSRYIRDYIERNAGFGKPLAISLGFPATIDKEKKYVVSAPNVKGVDSIPIVDILQKEHGIPVFLDRDVNMLISNDMYDLKLETSGIVMACYIGTGFGNAIWINGSIYSGYSGSAGELGHIPVLGRDDLCGCGNTGCIENYSGGKMLEHIHEAHYSKTDISDIFVKHGDEPLIQDFVEALSIPIAAEINILDPEYVILGGGVLQMKDFPRDLFEGFIRKHTRKPFPEKTLRIIYSEQRQENGVRGAGIYAFKALEKKEAAQ
ncbi:MAG TPA: allose kinase [Candidatus Atribacteria bacterium]|nr:allose kinase [Candidatus Atribacteria bacterium]